MTKSHNSVSALYLPITFSTLGLTFLMFALPVYGKALGGSALVIGGLYSVFTMTTLFLRPVVGWALDRFGRKQFLIVALIAYAIAMGLFAFAGTIPGLYLARFVQGFAASFFWISINTIIADLSVPEDRGKAMGRAIEHAARGQLLGALIGFTVFSNLPRAYSWQTVFLGYAFMAALGAWLAWKNVPETHTAPARQFQRPPLSKPLLKLMAIVFTTGAAMAMISPLYMIFLQDKFTTDVGTLALAFIPAGIVFSILPSRLGGLSDRFGRAPMMAVGLVGSGVLFMLLPHLPDLLWLIVLYTISAVGWAIADPAEAAMVADLTGQETRGTGYGLHRFADNLGGVIGPLIGGWLYDNISHATPFYLNGAILLFSAAWVLLMLRQTVVPKTDTYSSV